jgi:hypothetical protein
MVFAVVILGGRTGARVIIELVSVSLMVVGVVLGTIALIGVPKHGARGILAPALIGIVINGLLLFIFGSNFMGAKARAHAKVQESATSLAGFRAATPKPKVGNARQSYNDERLAFDYDGAYQLRINKENKQILLQHTDSNVLIGVPDQPGEVDAALKRQATALQQGLKNQSNSEFTQSAVENVAGSVRSGGLLRMEYHKLVEGRMHMDLYMFSGQSNPISVVHFYQDSKKATATRLFATVLQSLKDGS